MSVAYDTWRQEQKVKPESAGAEQLGRLMEITKAALAFVTGANSTFALVENLQQLLGQGNP